tara:strand:+ start:871 stop:1428 length:558 start_codon:yes stop_codon:yes gene_type:complete
MADNTTYNELVDFTSASGTGIVDNPRNIGDVMNNLAIRVIRETQQQLDNNASQGTTGNLRQSIEMPVKIFGTKFIAKLFMADYYDFINKGVKGKESSQKAPDSPYSYTTLKPPINPIKEWSRLKGLNPFAVRESIFRKGIKANRFWDKAYNEISTGNIFRQLERDLRTAGVNATTEGIRNLFKKN